MSLRLKATKTSLYKLVAEYAALPPMGRTTFKKAPCSRSYWLDWRTDGISYRAYISVCLGDPVLAIESTEYSEETGRHETVDRKTYKFTAEYLRERGMVEEK